MLTLCLALWTTPATACTSDCELEPLGIPTYSHDDVPLDATFLFHGVLGGSDLEVTWTGGGAPMYVPPEKVDTQMWRFTPPRLLAPRLQYRVYRENELVASFLTGRDVMEPIEPEVPEVVDSFYSSQGKKRDLSKCGAWGNHSETTVSWEGNAPLYEVQVTHRGKETTVMSTQPETSLGWRLPCRDNLDLKPDDKVKVQVRGWYWDGTPTEWSEQTKVDTTGGCACATPGSSGSSGWLLGLLAGLASRRRVSPPRQSGTPLRAR